MSEALTTITPLLTALGLSGIVGGILGAYFTARFQQQSRVSEREHDLKQKRYLCVLILMLTKLNPSVGLEKTRIIRPDLRTLQDVENELSTELLNAVVFASQPVLEALAEFIRSPTKSSFVAVASAMRTDLWGKGAAISADLVELLPLANLPEK
jgi:hypothetical protein